MFANSVEGWVLFSFIWAFGLYHLLYCSAASGLFGNNILTYMSFGSIAEHRDRNITVCIAYTNAGKYIAQMCGNDRFIAFYDAELYNQGYKIEARRGLFVVNHYNHQEFGYVGRWYGSDPDYLNRDNDDGTISFENRSELWNLKMNLTGGIILPPEKKSLFKMHKKEEVDLQ